jgi:UPF0755 protein
VEKFLREKLGQDLFGLHVFAVGYICTILLVKNIGGLRWMKLGNHLTKRLLIFTVVLLFVVGSIWLWWQDGISSVESNDKTPIEFVVKKGEGVKLIASRLAQQKIIRSPTAFYILVKIMGNEKQLQAGDFRLNRSMDAMTVSRELTHGTLDIWTTIPEGWRKEEIANRFSKDLDIPESEFIKIAPEGYLFPDTYLIPKDATVGAVVKLLTSTFTKKVDDVIKNGRVSNNMPMNEIIVLASIVEREGNSDIDRPIIAGILINRLKAKHPLQVDATLQYALGYQPEEKSWWKKILTNDDKEIASLYNTYLYNGLPPGPISNPGIESIKAVLNPKETDYFYYLHDVNGNVHYAKTLEEHNNNIEKYLK